MFGPNVGLNVPQQFVSLASVTDHKYATLKSYSEEYPHSFQGRQDQ